jgi:hypothetical protein
MQKLNNFGENLSWSRQTRMHALYSQQMLRCACGNLRGWVSRCFSLPGWAVVFTHMLHSPDCHVGDDGKELLRMVILGVRAAKFWGHFQRCIQATACNSSRELCHDSWCSDAIRTGYLSIQMQGITATPGYLLLLAH